MKKVFELLFVFGLLTAVGVAAEACDTALMEEKALEAVLDYAKVKGYAEPLTTEVSASPDKRFYFVTLSYSGVQTKWIAVGDGACGIETVGESRIRPQKIDDYDSIKDREFCETFGG